MRHLLTITLVLVVGGCGDDHSPVQSSRLSHVRHDASETKVRDDVEPDTVTTSPDGDLDVVVLDEIPVVTLSEELTPTHSDKLIEDLIASLADVADPDFALSPTLHGRAFSPLEGQAKADALLITDHKITTSDALKRLVAIGPNALPALLAHLDDLTPTKLTISHDGAFGEMWFANELRGNPVNKTERAVIQSRPKPDSVGSNVEDDGVELYTVKVGDVCLVAIGQITGRGYQAVRYQPTACIVLNSPTHDPELCAQVRAIWESNNPRQKLFDSLLLDYATRGKFNGESLDGWGVGSALQCESAMRLLYYFPGDTAALIAKRIDQFDVSRAGPLSAQQGQHSELERFIAREVANGARTDDFIAATMWSQHPKIRAAIRRVADRTDDKEIAELVGKAR